MIVFMLPYLFTTKHLEEDLLRQILFFHVYFDLLKLFCKFFELSSLNDDYGLFSSRFDFGFAMKLTTVSMIARKRGLIVEKSCKEAADGHVKKVKLEVRLFLIVFTSSSLIFFPRL